MYLDLDPPIYFQTQNGPESLFLKRVPPFGSGDLRYPLALTLPPWPISGSSGQWAVAGARRAALNLGSQS
jgi:hypothetical protein